MKLYDMHVHTKGISLCSRLSAEDLCRALKEDGSDGLILTNHFAPQHVTCALEAWLHKYEEEYYACREEAAKWGLGALFGIEVTLGGKGVEHILLYGVEPSCLYDSLQRPLWEYSLPELYAYAHDHDALLIHAHPYRSGCKPDDPRYLDGVEINCHPLYETSRREDVEAFAREHGLLLTCGSDYHGDVYKAHCGVWLPDELKTERELAAYFRRGQPELLVHDIDVEKARASNIHNHRK